MPSRVLETVLTGRNLLSPVLTGAAADVEAYDAKVGAANARAGESSATSAKVQETSAAKVTAANARTAESSSAASAKVVAANTRAAESSARFAEVTESSAARAGVAWGALATKGLPLVAAAAALVTGKMAADFQSNVVRLETTAGELPKNLKMVSKGILDMAGDVGVSANTLAKGMYVVESAGFHGRDALLVEKAAAQAAAQEHADLAKTTDAVTTALHDYNLPASAAAKVTSQMVTAVSHGKTTMEEFTGSLHSVTPLASALHVPLADILGDLAAMTASGESADQATQNMADALRHLQNPTSTMTSELAQLGITSSDLASDLSSKGLSGTIQEISDAIVQHLDPATQKVLLPALNQSRTATQDLQIMLGQMPPSLAKLSQGLVDGSVSLKDYRTDVRDLGGQAGPLGLQFLSLFQNSQGFSNILKGGGPAAQAYSAALQKAMGTSAGLTVALQLTGDHAATVNSSIKDISKSTGDASGNIKGWAEVEATAAQQAKEAAAGVGKLAIEMGQHLLPAATGALGYINRDVIPGLEHMGSTVGDAAHWFGQLPGPIKETVLAFAALRIATAINFLGISSGLSRVAAGGRAVSAAFAEEAAMQRWAATVNGITAVEGTAAAGMSRMAVAGGLASRAFTGMRSAGSRFVNMLGGPWMLATAGAVLGILAVKSAVDQHDEAVKRATQDVQAWDKALAIGPAGGASASAAAGHLGDLQKQIDATKTKISQLSGATDGGAQAIGNYGFHVGTFSAQIESNRSKLTDLYNELENGNKAWQTQLASMTPVEIAQFRVAQATKDLHDAQVKFPADSQEVSNAASRLADAQSGLAYQTSRANDASKTQLQRLQDLANKQLASVNSGLAAQQAQMQFTDAAAQYNANVQLGSEYTGNLAEDMNGLAQSAISAAQAAGQQAADQDKANGVTDTANDVNAAMLKSLQDNEKFLTGPAKAAVDQQIQILSNATVAQGVLTDAIKKMGLTTVTESDSFRKEWGDNVQVLSGATDAQIKDLEGLGLTVRNLPNHQIVVSADTGAARNALTQLSNDYGQYSINLGVKIGSGILARAAGGPIVGAGTATSDSIPVMASNGEHMWTAAEVQAAGGHGAMHALRSAVLGGALHRAGGGPVTFNDMFLTAKVGISPASMSAAEAAIKQMAAAAPGAPSNVSGNVALGRQMAGAYGWGSGAEWNSLYALGNRESGWRSTAQNPSSTAYGIGQFLDSTWATVGLSKTSNAVVQIAGMLKYIQKDYRDPIGAWAHETRYGWYDKGGPLYPGLTMALNTTGKTETIRTADQEQALQQRLGTSSPTAMPGYGTPFSGAVYGPTGPVNVTVQARVFLGNREITDIVRVEAHAVVDGALSALADTIHYAGG